MLIDIERYVNLESMFDKTYAPLYGAYDKEKLVAMT